MQKVVRDQSASSQLWEKEMVTYSPPVWKWVDQKEGLYKLNSEQGMPSSSRQLCT